MLRAGLYTSIIEKEINQSLKQKHKSIFWEEWLRTKNDKGRV